MDQVVQQACDITTDEWLVDASRDISILVLLSSGNIGGFLFLLGGWWLWVGRMDVLLSCSSWTSLSLSLSIKSREAAIY